MLRNTITKSISSIEQTKEENMTQTAASIQDMAHHLHPFSDNKQLKESGVRVIEKADGIYIYDNQGNKIIDGMAGLWCVNIGYGRKELGEIA